MQLFLRRFIPVGLVIAAFPLAQFVLQHVPAWLSLVAQLVFFLLIILSFIFLPPAYFDMLVLGGLHFEGGIGLAPKGATGYVITIAFYAAVCLLGAAVQFHYDRKSSHKGAHDF